MSCARGQILRVGRGFTASWTVTLRDEQGRAIDAGTYDGSEAIDLVLSDPATGLAITPIASTVAWDDPDGPTLTLTADDSDTAALAPGYYPLSIGLTKLGERHEVFRGTLRIEPRPLGS